MQRRQLAFGRMMEAGLVIAYIRTNDPPLKSREAVFVAAALACGYKYASKKPFCYTIEEKDGEAVTTASWAFEAKSKSEFVLPDGKRETVDFIEFRRRWNKDWCLANPHHPISHQFGLDEQFDSLRNNLRGMKPALYIRKGRRWCLIPDDATEEERTKLLQEFNR